MPSWPPKDPDGVLDYTYAIPLDTGDAVASSTFVRLSGTVAIDDQARTADVWTVTLSGGADGETSVFRIAWTTTGGRTDDDFVTLPVAAHEPEDLLLTGYAKPSAAHLIARYPAFADVDVSTIRIWLTDAERYVDHSWSEGDYAAALMALAAHNMASGGLGIDAAAFSSIPAGVTAMRSGTLSLNFSDSAAMDRISGAFASTRYGAEFLALLRRNRGGPRVMPTGVAPYDNIRWPQGE